MNKSTLSIFLGLAVSGSGFFISQYYGNSAIFCWTVAITLLCVSWWILEPIPVPVTALIPLGLFPLVGVLSPKQVGEAYGSPVILLLLGGALLSTAMSHSGAHRRIALTMVGWFGQSSQRHLVFGFMLAAASLSMWISNIATTLMLLPVATAIIEKAEDKSLALPLLLGIAFSASIGGMGTPVGTPPNLIFIQVYKEHTGMDIGFGEWMAMAVPVVVLFVPIVALWLTRNMAKASCPSLPALGPWRPEEKRVLAVFALTAFFWITRKEPFGGWSTLFGLENANDASVALLAVVLIFLIPKSDGSKEPLLTWKAASHIPWGVLLLFASGVCIAKAFIVSGLSQAIGDQLTAFTTVPVILMILCIALAVTFMTETVSNTASATLLMPILAAAALAAQVDPRLLMIPAVMSASCAFMLPIATGPNAIVFGSDKIRVSEMMREGLLLNFVGAIIITGVCYVALT